MLLIIASDNEMLCINTDNTTIKLETEDRLLIVNSTSLLAKKTINKQWLDLFLQKVNHAITHHEPILIERI